MRTYILKRLLLIVPTLLGAATPGVPDHARDPGRRGPPHLRRRPGRPHRSEAARRHARAARPGSPLLVQFGTWLWGVVRFDFGKSLWTGQPVIEELLIRLPLSLELALLATHGLGDHRHPPRHARRRPPGHLGGLRRPRGQHRRPRHPGVLGRHPVHPGPRDLLRLGPAARVHAAVGRSLGELPDDGLAGAHRRLPVRRRHHPHDALDGARGAARGLHPHRLGQGVAGAGRRHPPRAEELDAAR